MRPAYRVIVIGGGHAGVEAAWAAANALASREVRADDQTGRVALVTLDPAKTGVMSCNPAIGGLAKGQIVREVDALGGLMGLAADATGIQFKVLNTSKGPAVRGPRCQSDKHAYAEAVQAILAARDDIDVIAGAVDDLLIDAEGRCVGVRVSPPPEQKPLASGCTRDGHTPHVGFGQRAVRATTTIDLRADAVVLTTGTFMRGLMHTGDAKTPGGRFGEAPAVGMSATLARLGFELGRLKTGTPPRLDRTTIDWAALPDHPGDDHPTPFSDLSNTLDTDAALAAFPSLARFPVLDQIACKQTHTCEATHEHIHANLHRAPMFSGQIESAGPRYCPSIEDKVVRFADRQSHHVYLEPESLRDDWVYCNGISTSLPADVQDAIVRRLPGCEHATILRYGYAVEYDMVLPHQIQATGQTKRVPGLFLAGQINGTSGYEEAAGQGVVAGVNAALLALGEDPWTLARDEAYIGVLMDDLVTKTPREPYRMFTSRAEHRLVLRADNAADRLTPIADRLGLLAGHDLGRLRTDRFAERRCQMESLRATCRAIRDGERTLADVCRRPTFTPEDLAAMVLNVASQTFDASVVFTVHTEFRYEAYVARSRAEARRHAELEHRRIPAGFEPATNSGLRAEAREALGRFRPATFGQASRLEGVTPADLTLLSVLVRRWSESNAQAARLGAAD